jgi:hypothetical protein
MPPERQSVVRIVLASGGTELSPIWWIGRVLDRIPDAR